LPEKMESQHPSSFPVLCYKTAAACLLALEHICSQHRHLRRAGDEPLLHSRRGAEEGGSAERIPGTIWARRQSTLLPPLSEPARGRHRRCWGCSSRRWSTTSRASTGPSSTASPATVAARSRYFRSMNSSVVRTLHSAANDYWYNSHHLSSSARAHSVIAIPIQPDNGLSLGFKLQSLRDHVLVFVVRWPCDT
jgi:hypothetical protein